MKNSTLLIIILLAPLFGLHAQQWMEDIYNPAVSFYTVQREFYQWQQQHLTDTAVNDETTDLYKAWEDALVPLMRTTGGVRNGLFDSTEYCRNLQMLHTDNLARSASSADWKYAGPQSGFDALIGGVTIHNCKGRVNCIRFDKTDTTILYAGAAAGGLWQSNNLGTSWQMMNTDSLPQIGISDVAINPINNQSIFIATGDYPLGTSFSVGVLRSTDGGHRWDTCGLNYTPSQGVYFSSLLINPADTNIIIASVNNGVHRSVDGGHTWSARFGPNGFVKGMAFMPGNPAVVYAYGSKLYRSEDSGATWHLLNINSISNPGAISRLALAVSPQTPAYVYILASNTPASYAGLFISRDTGNTFSILTNDGPQLNLNFPDNSPGYDFELGVSPIDSNLIITGAVYTYTSVNNGVSWSKKLPPHSDTHCIQFYPHSNTVFSANDGGVFISTDSFNTWTGINTGLNIGQLYCISSSEQTSNKVLTSRQDNGSLLLINTIPSGATMVGGDGLNCLVDPVNDQIMYASRQHGSIAESTNGGVSFPLNIAGIDGRGPNITGTWITPLAINPQNDAIVLMGKNHIYEYLGGGPTDWNVLNSPYVDTAMRYTSLAYAHGDSNIIYAVTDTSSLIDTNNNVVPSNIIYRSIDGGISFENITANLTGPINDIAVSFNNPFLVYAATDTGVFYLSDTNTGDWVADTMGLPRGNGFYTRCIAVMNTANNARYAGLWSGPDVYYTNDDLGGVWTSYSKGLPNVRIRKLEISYRDTVIRAATFGRDVWQSPLADAVLSTLQQVPAAQPVFKIWPNPTLDNLNITFTPTEPGAVELKISDMLGQILYDYNLGVESTHIEKTFNISVASGIYLAIISCGRSQVTQRLAIVRN